MKRDMPLYVVVAKIVLALCAGYIWWQFNVVKGNAVLIEHFGFFMGAGIVMRGYVLPAVPSIVQLLLTEDFRDSFLSSKAASAFAVTVAVLDTVGPAYAFLLVNGYALTPGWIVVALGFGFFVSVLCQHVAWINIKDVFKHIFSSPPSPPSSRPARVEEIAMGRR